MKLHKTFKQDIHLTCMEEILKIDLQGFKATYNAKWSEEEDVCNLNNVKQVNGVLFNGDGEILIVNVVGNWVNDEQTAIKAVYIRDISMEKRIHKIVN